MTINEQGELLTSLEVKEENPLHKKAPGLQTPDSYCSWAVVAGGRAAALSEQSGPW